MASCKFYSFLNFLLFYVFIQQILSSNSADLVCAPVKFKSGEKVTVEYFFESDDEKGLYEYLCQVIEGSGNLMSIAYRMGANVRVDNNGHLYCEKCDLTQDRIYACNYKQNEKIYNTCGSVLPILDPFWLGNCVCTGLADYILIHNSQERENTYKIPESYIPALVMNGKWDPCFTDFSLEGIKTYFCTAYNNALPICK